MLMFESSGELLRDYARRVLRARRRALLSREHLSRRNVIDLGRLAAALLRLDRGTWGMCHRCGATIETSRLFAQPEVDCCAACAAGA